MAINISNDDVKNITIDGEEVKDVTIDNNICYHKLEPPTIDGGVSYSEGGMYALLLNKDPYPVDIYAELDNNSPTEKVGDEIEEDNDADMINNDLKPNTEYTLYVQARDAQDSAIAVDSEVVSETFITDKIPAPRLEIVETTYDSVEVRVENCSSDFSLDLYVEIDEEPPTNNEGEVDTKTSITYTKDGLDPDTQYTVYAQAKDPDGEYDDSDVSSKTFTTEEAEPMSAPTIQDLETYSDGIEVGVINEDDEVADLYCEIDNDPPNDLFIEDADSGQGDLQRMGDLSPETKYTVYAQAKDPNGVRPDSDVVSETFTTEVKYEWVLIDESSSDPTDDVDFTFSHQGSEEDDIDYLESNYPPIDHAGELATTEDGQAEYNGWGVFESVEK